MSTTAETKKAPSDENSADDVLFNSVFGVRTIELNRPSKLNALNKSMAEKIVPRLQVRLLPPAAIAIAIAMAVAALVAPHL